ncbi:MAG: tetratricopeptide repeat protein, partial [Rickettsiales bacterium]|nr:tetratricopeptide repeat protein [Rickettsiales bacterium]
QLLSEVLLMQNYIDLAIETLNQLVEIDPANAPAQVRLAQMYNANKDSERALKLLEIVTRTHPGYPVAWEAIARIAIERGDMEAARKAIAQLETFKGQGEVAGFLNGQMAQASGNSADAKTTYRKIIETDPNSPLAERAVFELVEKHKTSDELRDTVQFLETLTTDSPYINTIIGEGHITLGDTAKAIPALDKAIAGHALMQDPYLNRAKIHRDNAETEKAIELLKQAARMNKGDVRADLILADIYNAQQNYKASIAIYEDVASRFPELEMPANNMAALIAEHFYTDKALLEKAAKLAERFEGSKNPSFLDTLSWVYYRQGKAAQAQATMARAMALLPDAPPEMHYHYGAILLLAGNKVKGKEELEKATSKTATPEIQSRAGQLLKEI